MNLCRDAFGSKGKTVKFKLGWNTVKEDDFKKRLVDKNVRVVIQEKTSKGYEGKRSKSDVRKKIQQRATIKNKSGHSC
jgi:hypothetical protein